MIFTAKDGYVLTADTVATVNGILQDGATVANTGLNHDGELVVWVTLPAQEQQGGELGDVNGDGEVDNVDAAIVLQYDAGILDEADIVNFSLGDVNADGEVDNVDAALVLQYDAGLIDEF